MSENINDAPDKEPESGVVTSDGFASAFPKNQDSNPLSGISRAITDEELKESIGARKLLLYAYDRMEKECFEFRSLADKYHEDEKKLAECTVRLKYLGQAFNIGDLCKMIGGVLLGFAVNHIDVLLWVVIGLLAVILMIGPFIYQHYISKRKD